MSVSFSAPHGVANTDALGRATLRRVTVRLLPFLFVLYVANYLDRSNVAIAALQMNRDLRFSATAYGFGAGIFFLGYALCEVPSNLILVRVGARRWIARIMITWGVIAALMLFVRTPVQFYALRFLLGAAEAGFFPGIVFYLTRWFPMRERARAISLFMIAIPLSGAIGNPLSAALLGLDGRLHLAGWQWLFLLEGLPSVLLGILVLRWLTECPADAHWLSDAERLWLVTRMRDDDAARATAHELPALRALAHPMVWMLGVTYFLASLIYYVYLFWAPTMIRDALHASPLMVGVLLGIIGVSAAASMFIGAVSTDRHGHHCMHVAVPMVITAAGYAGAALMPTPTGRVAGLALAAIAPMAINPPFWCLPAMLLRGNAVAFGMAFVNTLGALGGFAGPYLMGRIVDATGSTTDGFLAASVLALVSSGIMLALRSEPAFVAVPVGAPVPA